MKKKPNILFFGMECTRSDHMSLYGYHRLTTPHIDKYLSEDSIICDKFFAPSIPTPPGYSSILTGMDCFGTEIVALRHKGQMTSKVRSLPEVLRDEGYNSTCIGFTGNAASRGFDKYMEPKVTWGSWEEGRSNKAGSMNEIAIPELKRLAGKKEPFLLFLRHMDPHAPYLPPEPFERMFYHGNEYDKRNKSLKKLYEFKPFRDFFYTWFPPYCTSSDYVIAQYDGSIAYMDSCISNILETLRELGLEEDTIVVFTSDHGETLTEHEYYFDHHGLYDCTLSIPCAIKWKGHIKGTTRIKDPCQQKDIMPTLMDLMELDTGIDFNGNSLMPLLRGEERIPEPEMYITECTWQRKHGWRTPEWKLIVALEPDFHYKEPKELYNLVKDPGENRNVIKENPDIAEVLEKRMYEHIAKREAAEGVTNPLYTNLTWYREKGPFTSSDEAYNEIYIGDPEAAKRLQAPNKKRSSLINTEGMNKRNVKSMCYRDGSDR